MPTPVTLTDLTLVLSGKFSTPRADLEHELTAIHGVRVTSSVSSRTDLLVTGSEPGHDKSADARALGIRIIDEATLRALMRGDDVELAPIGEGGEQPMNALLGEARGLLSEPMGIATWEALVKLLDACAIAQQETLVTYLEPQLARWDEPETKSLAIKRWSERARQADALHGTAYRELMTWITSRDATNLRFVPEHWLGEMMQGSQAPKYRLARSLNLHGFRTANKKIQAILTHPHLTSLHSLTLGHSNTLTKTNAKAVLEHPNFARLHLLSWGILPLPCLRYIHETSAKNTPRVIDISGVSIYSERDVEQIVEPLLTAPIFEKARSLVIPWGAHNRGTSAFCRLLTRSDVVPELEHLNLSQTLKELDALRALTPVLERVAEVKLNGYWLPMKRSSEWKTMCRHALPESVHTVDLSTMMFEHEQDPTSYNRWSTMLLAPDKVITSAFNVLCPSPLLSHVKRVRLGPLLHHPRIVERFAHHRPDIELVP